MYVSMYVSMYVCVCMYVCIYVCMCVCNKNIQAYVYDNISYLYMILYIILWNMIYNIWLYIKKTFISLHHLHFHHNFPATPRTWVGPERTHRWSGPAGHRPAASLAKPDKAPWRWTSGWKTKGKTSWFISLSNYSYQYHKP